METERFASESPEEQRFDWPLCYEAENEILRLIHEFTQQNTFCRELANRMQEETGTLLIDWTDHLVVGPDVENALGPVGFVKDEESEALHTQKVLFHPQAMLPRVMVDRERAAGAGVVALAIKVDHVSDFLAAQRLSNEPDGDPLSRFRRVRVSEDNGTWMEAVERRGYRGFVPVLCQSIQIKSYLRATELWQTRPRYLEDEAEAYRRSHRILDKMIALVGMDQACHIVFAEERRYWERRNHAARVQKFRQDGLGLGWANHDHHTFRSSRRHFLGLMHFMEKLGFERRERYYAGDEAGWGAQVWEQPVEGIVTFCDVDLQPGETEVDFSRQPVPETDRLGTIGLWTALHGESFLQAGMHHLECRFDYEATRRQLSEAGVETMKPFSDFPFLKQAFTEGERWAVAPARIDALLQGGKITPEQAGHFRREGAMGSHLENLQRKGGFKGFNQKSVSAIIEATDPRQTHARAE